MFYKSVLLALIALLTLSLVSCGKNAITEKPGPNTVSSISDDKTREANNQAYGIVPETYVYKGIKVHYPQITGLSDVNKQEKLNCLLREGALAVANDNEPVKDITTVEIKHDIKWLGKRLLSVQYSGVIYVQRAAYPRQLFYTTNIDLDAAKKVTLADVVCIDEGFVKKVEKGEFIARDGLRSAVEEIKGYISSHNKIAECLNPADAASRYIYFTNDSLGISFDVLHALGDHAEFEIKYKDLKENIQYDNPIWKDFI